jgi:hypothetical protein
MLICILFLVITRIYRINGIITSKVCFFLAKHTLEPIRQSKHYWGLQNSFVGNQNIVRKSEILPQFIHRGMALAPQVLSMFEERKQELSAGQANDFRRPRDDLVFCSNWQFIKDLYQFHAALQAGEFSQNIDYF